MEQRGWWRMLRSVKLANQLSAFSYQKTILFIHPINTSVLATNAQRKPLMNCSF